MGCFNSKSGVDKTTEKQRMIQAIVSDKIYHDNFIKQNIGKPKDDYIELKTLGEGTYGKVIKVQQKKGNNEIRAMKKIPKESLSTEEQRKKMVYDIIILKQLDHPNILKIYEFYQDEYFFYVVTEFCEGNDLSFRLESQHSMSEKEAANVVKQMLEVVKYSHAQNIAHRDLKPENVMLDEKVQGQSGDYLIKIIDWGCSAVFDPTPGKFMSDLVGTPYFIAPEVITKRYTKAADLWSIGAILYHLISGDYCFSGKSIDEILGIISKSQNWDFQGQIWGDISSDCKDLIKKLMTFDYQKRITAEEALKHQWLKNAPSHPLNNELRLQSIKKLKKHKQRSEFQNAVLTYISSQLVSKNEKKDLIAAFKGIDKDESGTLTIDEIKNYYKGLLDEKEVQAITENIDINNNGLVNYTEFVNAMYDEKKLLTEDKLKQAFKFFDQDNNGFITRDEIMEYFGQGLTGNLKQQNEERFNFMMEKADKNHDGKLNYEEFKTLMLELINVEV